MKPKENKEQRSKGNGDTADRRVAPSRHPPIVRRPMFYVPSLFSVAVILLTLAAGRTATFRTVERVTIDLRFRMRRQVAAVDPRLSLVLVDSTAMHKYGYPVPRRYYAVVANAICENGASALSIDRTFEARDVADPAGSAMLTKAFEKHGNIISGWYSLIRDKVYSTGPPVVPLRFAMPHEIEEIGISPCETSLYPEQVSLPYRQALQSISWLGSVTMKPTEQGDDRIEKAPLVVKHGNRIYPAISLMTVCVALKVDLADITIERDRISIPTQDGVITIPTDEKGQVRINYLGDMSVFLENRYSLSSIYDSVLSGVPLEFFKDGIALMGNEDIMGADMYSTPFGRALMPGVAIHAMIINSILQRRFIDTASWYYDLLILAVSVLCISYIQKLLSPRLSPICFVALLIWIWAGAAASFQFKGVLINVSQPIFGVVFAFTSTSFYNYVVERRRVNHIKQVFGKHVSQEVVDRLILETTDGQIPMAEQEVSALFADIVGHSNWASRLRPSDFAGELNECLEAMVQAVFENGGTINVFLGDGVLVLYNAPVEQDDHALRAIKTGIAIQEHISELNERRALQGREPIAVRVGINTGRAMAGTLGSKDRLEYTVIGDTIIMAKRTEGECEPGRVAITADVARRIGEAVEVEPIGLRSVKGREYGLMLYHVVRIKEEGGQAPYALS
jgi:class 3 adenylate cyclase/CHASE2 domain-containing sensor protein